MMTEVNLLNESRADTWGRIAPELSLTQLDNLERDGVNIQCLNSSDFVIGRQTNFNGPVTIITCADVLKRRGYEDERDDVIIRDKVLSPSAAMKVQKLATEKSEGGGRQDLPERSRFGKYKKPTWIFALVCIGLLMAASVSLAALPTKSTEVPQPKCTPLPNKHCIFSEFEWGGRRNSSKPLRTPVPYVVISQTYNDYCFEKTACLKITKRLQLNTSDETSCNFFVGSDGNAYEDRGWLWESNLEGPVAGKGVQICFMGNYSDFEILTYPQKTTALTLIEIGIKRSTLDPYTEQSSNGLIFPRIRFLHGGTPTRVQKHNMTYPRKDRALIKAVSTAAFSLIAKFILVRRIYYSWSAFL